MTEEHRNMILAVVVSVVILLGFELFFSKKREAVPPQSASTGISETPTPGAQPSAKPSAKSPPGGRSAATPTAPGAKTTVAGAALARRQLAHHVEQGAPTHAGTSRASSSWASRGKVGPGISAECQRRRVRTTPGRNTIGQRSSLIRIALPLR